MGTFRSLASRLILGVLVFSFSQIPVFAQEVRWRHQYRPALQEARQKHRPLLLDFGTSNCFWCRKMDVTTFRDPTIVRILNQELVPLKIDADRDIFLTQALGIQGFPTLVLAGPDGKILAVLDGYTDAATLRPQLERLVAQVQPIDEMTRDYQRVAQAIAMPDYPQAIGLLKKLVLDQRNPTVQARAKKLLEELETQASGRLGKANELKRMGRRDEARVVLEDLLRTFPGTRASREAGTLLSARAE